MSEVSGKILVVDDDPAIRALLAEVLGNEYSVWTASGGEEALAIAQQVRPELVLLDLMMPEMDGYDTCRLLRSEPGGKSIHVIVVSAASSYVEQLRALKCGADDYIVKPFDPYVLRSRVRLHFRLRQAEEQVSAVRSEIEAQSSQARRAIEDQRRELMATQDVAVFVLAKVAECRDHETGNHLMRMRGYSQLLAEELQRNSPYADQIDRQFLDDLYRSSPLHDVGKVGISDQILLKPGRLTPDEFEKMKEHTTLGAQILDEAVWQQHGGAFLAMAATIARHHHERFDGTGYPSGLAGTDIPLPARIVAVADVYDALTSQRPYKPAYSPLDSKEMILIESGRHFDPVVVDAFEARFDDILEIQRQFNDQITGQRPNLPADLAKAPPLEVSPPGQTQPSPSS
ncbi:MAG: response regulator [Pirellulales bacterium]|nr:response regulator [Pirellulales bacterium]